MGWDRLDPVCDGDLEVGAALCELNWDFTAYVALTLGVPSCVQVICMCISVVAPVQQAGESLHRIWSVANQLSFNIPTG